MRKSNLIVSWSPVKGQGGTTSNTAALAAMFSLEYSSTNIIAHTADQTTNLELMFGKEFERGVMFNGTSALKRLAKSGSITPVEVPNYVETIFKDRLDILCNTDDMGNNDRFLRALHPVIANAYTNLWIDACGDINNEHVVRLLQDADLVILNLPQNKFAIDLYHDRVREILAGKKVIVVISSYDEDSYLTTRKIKNDYKIKGIKVLPVMYSKDFKDSSNKKSVSKFFYQNIMSIKDNSNTPFINSLREINKQISKILDIGILEEASE